MRPLPCHSGAPSSTPISSARYRVDDDPTTQGAFMLRNRKGFTLIELLIVVVIIGILAAIAIPKFANTKQKAYITAMKSDLRNLVTSGEAYFSDSSSYTATIANLKYNSSTGVSSPTVVLGTGTVSYTHLTLPTSD